MGHGNRHPCNRPTKRILHTISGKGWFMILRLWGRLSRGSTRLGGRTTSNRSRAAAPEKSATRADRRGPATVANALEGTMKMKMITYAMLALGLMAALPVEANAVVCARGPYRAGCAGPHGAVGVHRGYGSMAARWWFGAATAIVAGSASTAKAQKRICDRVGGRASSPLSPARFISWGDRKNEEQPASRPRRGRNDRVHELRRVSVHPFHL